MVEGKHKQCQMGFFLAQSLLIEAAKNIILSPVVSKTNTCSLLFHLAFINNSS